MPASPQDLFPRFSITHSLYQTEFSTDVRADPEDENLRGTQLNVERDLGLESSEQVNRLSATWRPFARHEIAYSRFGTSRRGFRAIDEEIVFRDEIYPVTAQVSTSVDLDYWDATYTFWARRAERDGLGIMLGVTGLDVRSRLSATTPGQSVAFTQQAETDVPIALIGLQWRRMLTRRLYIHASAATLPEVEIDTYSGSAVNGIASIEYIVARNLRLGLAYNYFNLDGRVDDPEFSGELGLEMSGAEVFVRLAF